MKSIFEQNGGTYTQVGDYLIPDISLPDAPAYPIGKYGRMREAYLKEYRPGLYTRLILSGKLHEHLADVERTCNERLDTMIPQMAKAQGVTEAMKARYQLGWVGRMQKCGKPDHAGMQEVQKQIAAAKAAIQHVDERQAVIHETIAKIKRSFSNLLNNPEGHELERLEQERLAVRHDAETVMRFEIEEKTGMPIQKQFYEDSLCDVEKSLITQEKQQFKKQIAREERHKKSGWIL